MKNTIANVLVLVSIGVLPNAWADDSHHAAPNASAPAAAMTDGEVRKIDKDTGKITLRHGEIKNLGMPSMTMVFKAKDPVMLDAVKPGDKVLFTAERIDGAITVTAIQLAN
ncbi:MAG TPA: copper-binding protein [Burkholderiaceae bacterium]|nr:copper-binding protein [Burkholderiaceae bacterium]